MNSQSNDVVMKQTYIKAHGTIVKYPNFIVNLVINRRAVCSGYYYIITTTYEQVVLMRVEKRAEALIHVWFSAL